MKLLPRITLYNGAIYPTKYKHSGPFLQTTYYIKIVVPKAI